MPDVADSVVPLHYYGLLGTLQLQSGQYDAAERAFLAVLAVAEAGRKPLESGGDRHEWDLETRNAYRGLVEIRLRRNHDPYGALDLWERYRAAALRSPPPGEGRRHSRAQDLGIDFQGLDAGPPLPRIEPVRSMLPSLGSVTVLSYAQLREGLAIWAFDDRGIEAKWVPVAPETLEPRSRRFAEQCSDPASDRSGLRAAGAELYQWLIAPVEDHLAPGRTIVVETDGALDGVPVEALVDSSGAYFGARHAVMFSPAASGKRIPAQARFSSRPLALVAGAPALSGSMAQEFAPLPGAEREARVVASRFENATLLTGRKATAKALEDGLSRAEVFHFAGHSLANPSHRGLLVAPPESDPAKDFDLLDAAGLPPGSLRQCKLAVFSACSTVEREQSSGDPQSLVNGFLRAGVSCVVAGRWSVDSTAAEALMETFYSGLLTGRPVPEALQAAAARIREQPETAHPYYWAAFSAFGR